MTIQDAPIRGGEPVATVAQALSFLTRRNGGRLTGVEITEIVDAIWELGLLCRVRPDIVVAHTCHETANYTFPGQVNIAQKNVAGIGATNDGAPGLSNPTWRRGIMQYFLHLAVWGGWLEDAQRAFGLAREQAVTLDPRIPIVERVRTEKGPATTWRSLGGRWGLRNDVPWQDQATMPNSYGDRIAGHYAALIAEPKQEGPAMTPRTVTDRTIATLRQRGVEVIDLRGKLPVNPDPAERYGLVGGGLGGVQYLIQHWTGDNFSRQFGIDVTGTPFEGGIIPPNLSVDDETDLLRWYAQYHVSKDGGTWGGIAYGMMALPSGRVYVNWDIGTLTYHAFAGGNRVSYALCAPISRNAPPTQAQLRALNHIWMALCFDTPETPAGHGQLLGHSEAVTLDAQNQTSCPGVPLLGHVRTFRGTGKPTVAIDVPTPAPTPTPTPTPTENPNRRFLLGVITADFPRSEVPRYLGTLLWEGEFTEASYRGAKERVAVYDKAALHSWQGNVQQFYREGPTSLGALMAAGKVVRW